MAQKMSEVIGSTEYCWVDFSEEVNRGAKLLDEKIPGWAGVIDLGELRLDNIHSCILGQVFVREVVNGLVDEHGPHYCGGLQWLFGRRFAESTSARHGFSLCDGTPFDSLARHMTEPDEVDFIGRVPREYSYEAVNRLWENLAEAWIEAIRERRGSRRKAKLPAKPLVSA